ncbi:IS5/IS1182 family transposase [Micromonospora tulbaghiae]|uniref:IS5/IS1182 family transposase n=1 Tax=Micromonospora tulbaghiae TaxID=479978 RepID=A0A386WE19_9ACTN|nr:IS5 family transposase [Micromonospora tulbaghiae]AYF26636.1 IS5/IS1182 family transposase [Micromonospora tulbaghiae]
MSARPACGFYPYSSLTDAQWAIIEPLLPVPGSNAGRGGRPEKHSRRLVLDAIFYLVRGGIAWRQLPVGFPPPTTVYDRFRAWAKAGVWQGIHDALRDLVRVYEGRAPQPTAAIIDSQSVRGADTVPRASRGYDAGKKINGTKRHLAVDTGGLLLAVVVTMAGLQDRDAAHRLLARLRERFTTIALVWADAGYAGRLLVWARTVLHLNVQIVKRSEPGFVVLPRRWVVERTFAWISKHRRCVRDYETKRDHHEAMIYIAMIMTMSRRLARTGNW